MFVSSAKNPKIKCLFKIDQYVLFVKSCKICTMNIISTIFFHKHYTKICSTFRDRAQLTRFVTQRIYTNQNEYYESISGAFALFHVGCVQS